MNQGPADSSVPIGERVDRLELRVSQARLDEWPVRGAVHVPDGSSTRVGTISGGGGTNCALRDSRTRSSSGPCGFSMPVVRQQTIVSASMSVIVMVGELTSSPDAVRRTAMLFAIQFRLVAETPDLLGRSGPVRRAPPAATVRCMLIIELEMA